MVSDIAIANT